ncbi:DNA cytosine methyltransferase [Chloroflexota bacterium]
MNNTLTSIDLFAGCGGLSLGLEEAGFTPLIFSEINRDAAATYTMNRNELLIPNYDDVYTLTNSALEKLTLEWHFPEGITRVITDALEKSGRLGCVQSNITMRVAFPLLKNNTGDNTKPP